MQQFCTFNTIGNFRPHSHLKPRMIYTPNQRRPTSITTSGLLHPDIMIKHIRHTFEEMARSQQNRQRNLAFLALSFALIVYGVQQNWETIKHIAVREGAEVIQESMQSEKLQMTASEFSKQVMDNILSDSRFAMVASKWVHELLKSSEHEVAMLLSKALSTETVQTKVKELSNVIVTHLVNDPKVQEQVAHLLVMAINVPYAKKMAADWCMELFYREDVSAAFQSSVSTNVLQSSTLQNQAFEIIVKLLGQTVRDTSVEDMVRTFLIKILVDPLLQQEASDALWSILKHTIGFNRWSTSRETSEVSTTSVPNQIENKNSVDVTQEKNQNDENDETHFKVKNISVSLHETAPTSDNAKPDVSLDTPLL